MKPFARFAAAFAIAFSLLCSTITLADPPKLLVYTRQAKTVEGKPGFIHDNTKAAVAMLQKLGADNGFTLDVSEDPAGFTDANLKQYKALIFPSTNNQIFETPEQQAALQTFMRAGGGLVGIHSATGSMRAWPWFATMIGGRFQRHPKLQPFTINVVDRQHPSTSFLGEKWKWEDEFYFHTLLAEDNHILLAGDLNTITDKDKPRTADNTYPLAWCREFEGGRIWYTALGHKAEYYANPEFQKHVLGGIQWVLAPKPAAGKVEAEKK